MKISNPSIIRLCQIHRLARELSAQGVTRISSREIGEHINASGHSIRKDLSMVGDVGETGAGYDTAHLHEKISVALGIDVRHKICIVGLGQLGLALLHHMYETGRYDAVAGFDSSINRLETIDVQVPVFPAYDISAVVKRLQVSIGYIAVPASAAQDVADKLIAGGVTGIINFAPIILSAGASATVIRNVDVDVETAIVSSLMNLHKS